MTPRDILGSDLLSWRHLAADGTHDVELMPAEIVDEAGHDEEDDEPIDETLHGT